MHATSISALPPELKVVVPYVDGRSVFQDFNDRMAFKGCLPKGEFWVGGRAPPGALTM